MSKSKVNIQCIVGTDQGAVKIINGFKLIEESQINLQIGSINQISKFNDEYFISAENKVYSFKDFSSTEQNIVYTPLNEDSDIFKFDFFNEGFVVGFENEIHFVNNNTLTFKIKQGLYDDFCLIRNNLIATGGDKNEVSVYDIALPEKAIFSGKTEANKALSIPAKIHITSIVQDTDNDNIIYCGSKFNTVQLYDIRSNQRKPQNTANFDINYSVNKLTSLSSQRVIASSSRGVLGIIDFRFIPKNKLPAKNVPSRFEKFSGTSAGIMTGTAIVNEVNVGANGKNQTTILVTTSFDRQLRLYDVSTRLLLDKMYIGSKGTCVLVDSINESNDEDMWRDLDKIEDETLSDKKRTMQSEEKVDSKRTRNCL